MDRGPDVVRQAAVRPERPGELGPRQRWAAFVGILLVVCARAPYLLTQGRFWAEEGAVHFRHATSHGIGEALVFAYERAGYLNLHANLSTTFAARVPLEVAPLITAWSSLVVVATLAWCALAWPSRLLATPSARLAAALLLVVGPLATPEVWLTSLHAQVYLGLVVLLIAFVPTSELSRRQHAVGGSLLLLGGLSGLYSVALTPLFWLQAWRERTVRAVGYASVLTVAGLVQATVLLDASRSDRLSGKHTTVPGLDGVYRSLAGRHASPLFLGHELGERRSFELLGPRGILFGFLLLALVGLLVAIGLRLHDRRPLIDLGLAFVLVELLVQVGAIAEPVGGRYAVVPIGILILALVHGATMVPPGAVRWAAASACGIILVVGLAEYWTREPEMLRCRDCPVWADQVDLYEAGETTELLIWPYDEARWVVVLPGP